MSTAYRVGDYEFSTREVRDLLVAWAALGVAFTIFFAGGGPNVAALLGPSLAVLLGVSLLTAGVAFLLHEIAHKVVAVNYGQVAEFRADYSMLFLAIMSALLGFIFAAPGAVHHRGYLSEREHGHIAIAGPVMNLVLAVVFLPVYLGGVGLNLGLLVLLGQLGIIVNLFLAAFNLVPYGPLDGKTVIAWSKPVWGGTFLLSAALTYIAWTTLDISII
ncbi:metalloprotease [Halonotius terrestris]|uniref:Metalloprotease n=1 Tax=Halonotius terrestris TaxID=2487750 RepID=A0A8J8PBS7_9EURY|nr:metalloprotease [Halonotius terrestris]TQQ81132.1 metalloprotease [Halonotius terrestris]